MTPKPNQTLDRVRKLINLASSSNLKEAEVAAFRACALIRDYGLDIIDPDDIDAIYEENKALTAKVKELEAANTITEDHTSPLTMTGAYVHGATQWPSAASSGYVPYAPPAQQQAPMTPRPLAALRFAGQCRCCGKTINQGEPGLWIKGKGVWCNDHCYDAWTTGQTLKAKAAAFNPFGP